METDAIALTDEQRAELDKRLDAAEANPGQGRPWSEIRDRLFERAKADC